MNCSFIAYYRMVDDIRQNCQVQRISPLLSDTARDGVKNKGASLWGEAPGWSDVKQRRDEASRPAVRRLIIGP